jgi:seryl-tRNA synthetase
MLDWRRIVQNKEAFLKAYATRGMAAAEVSSLYSTIEELSKERVKTQTEADALKAERNKTSEEVSKLMKAGKREDAQKLIELGKQLGAKIEESEKLLGATEGRFEKVLEVLPNWPHESVPAGASAADNAVVREWGTKRSFDFEPKSHDEIGEKTGLIDFARAAKISGARFVFLRGGLARLERALVNFMLDTHRSKGYEEVVPPYMANASAFYGTGQFPKFVEDVFHLEGHDKYLIPTAEVPVTNYYAGEILAEEDLPTKFMAFSPCFRSEAGSYGKDTKGLIRQHQFHKVELVKFAHPENSLDELEALTKDAESVLQALEIPYRTVLLCTGDMGFGSRKTYDIEVWLPGSVFETAGNQRGCYREISSCSDFGDFQARRAKIRFKGKGGKGTQFAHTLNGSGLAIGRTLVAVVENYQHADGSIEVPKALRPYMGGLEVIEGLKN